MIPYWYLVLACVVCLVAGFAAGSARLRGLQQVVERLDARLATLPQPQPTAVCAPGLAEAAETLAGASMQETTMQLPVARVEPDDLDRSVADETRCDPQLGPALADAEAAHDRSNLAAALELQRDVLTAVRDEQPQRHDWGDLHDVEPDEDEPGDDEQPPPSTGGGGMHVEVVAPRFQPPTPAERWPAHRGVLPSGWMTRAGWRLRTWWVRLRREAAVLRQMEARGWEPGEARQVVGRHRPEVVEEERQRQAAVRPVGRVLRPDWRDILRPPKQTVLPILPGLRCVP